MQSNFLYGYGKDDYSSMQQLENLMVAVKGESDHLFLYGRDGSGTTGGMEGGF